MSTNEISLTEHELHLATQYELELEYLTSPAALQSIEEYFGPGGTFWSEPIIFDGESIFDGILNVAGEGSINTGDANGTDTSMDISMGDNTDSDKTIDNGIGDATSSESNALTNIVTDSDLFHAYLVSDDEIGSNNYNNSVATNQQAPKEKQPELPNSTSDTLLTSTKPASVQQGITSPPPSPQRQVHAHGTDGAIDSSPPAPSLHDQVQPCGTDSAIATNPPAQQQRSSRVSKPKPQHFHRRTTRSMKGAEELRQEMEDKQEEVGAKRSKPTSATSETKNAKGGKNLPIRKRQQPQRAVKSKK